MEIAATVVQASPAVKCYPECPARGGITEGRSAAWGSGHSVVGEQRRHHRPGKARTLTLHVGLQRRVLPRPRTPARPPSSSPRHRSGRSAERRARHGGRGPAARPSEGPGPERRRCGPARPAGGRRGAGTPLAVRAGTRAGPERSGPGASGSAANGTSARVAACGGGASGRPGGANGRGRGHGRARAARAGTDDDGQRAAPASRARARQN